MGINLNKDNIKKLTIDNKDVKQIKISNKEVWSKKQAKITFNSSVTYGENFAFTLKDNWNNPIANQIITVNINGSNETVTTNTNGIATIKVTKAPGTYSVTATISVGEYWDTTTVTQNVTINKALTTLTISNPSSTYGASGAYPTFTCGKTGGTITWKVGTVNQTTFTVSTSKTTNQQIKNVSTTGSYTISATYSDSYYTATATATYTINKATPTLTVTGCTYTYGGSCNAVVKSSVAGKISYTGAKIGEISVSANTNTNVSMSGHNAGTQTLSCTFVPTDTTNYNSITTAKTATITINKADVDIVVVNTSILSYDTLRWKVMRGDTELTSSTGKTIIKCSQTNYTDWVNTYQINIGQTFMPIAWRYVGRLYMEITFTGDENHNSKTIQKDIPITNVIFEHTQANNVSHINGNGTLQGAGSYSVITHAKDVMDIWEFGPDLNLKSGRQIGISCQYNINGNTRVEFVVGVHEVGASNIIGTYAANTTFLGEEWNNGTWSNKGSGTISPPNGTRKALVTVLNNAGVYKKCSSRLTSSTFDSAIQANVDWASSNNVYSKTNAKAIIMLRGPACTNFIISHLRIYYI